MLEVPGMRLSLLAVASIFATAGLAHAEPTRDIDLGGTVGTDGIMKHGAIALGGSEQLSDIISGLPTMLRAHIQFELGKALGAGVSDGGFQSKRFGLELRPCLSPQLCIIAGADVGYIIEDVTRTTTSSGRSDSSTPSGLDADLGIVAIGRLAVDLGLDTHWRLRVGIEHTMGLQSVDQLDSSGSGKNALDGWSGSALLSFRF